MEILHFFYRAILSSLLVQINKERERERERGKEHSNSLPLFLSLSHRGKSRGTSRLVARWPAAAVALRSPLLTREFHFLLINAQTKLEKSPIRRQTPEQVWIRCNARYGPRASIRTIP
jgi:hypothetical protein